MRLTHRPHLFLALAAAALTAACASGPEGPIPPAYLTGTSLDNNEIGVGEDIRSIQVAVDARNAWINPADHARIRAFAADYRQRGHGLLVVSVPASLGADPYAVAAVSEMRDIAWAEGVAYDDLRARAYDPAGRRDAPLLLSFQAYTAIAPYCPPKFAVQFSDITSNNDMETLGCSVRVNQAAMIAEPADLLGQRALEDGDIVRRQNQLELYRTGEPTAAERSESETGTISNAVN